MVEVTKLRACNHPCARPGNSNSYPIGGISSTHSLPVDYRMVGYELGVAQIRKPFRLFRISRNGVHVPGVFVSSPVSAITKDGFVTLNSVYRVRQLPARTAHKLGVQSGRMRRRWLEQAAVECYQSRELSREDVSGILGMSLEETEEFLAKHQCFRHDELEGLERDR